MSKMITGGLLLAVVALGWAADHYYGKAMDWRDKYRTAYSTTQQQADTIATMNVRQQSLAALDAKHTKELANAKNQIRALERDVAAGRKRLQLNARCPAMPVGESSGATGMDDAASPRLTDSAQRDYYTLRDGIAKARQQIDGLQEYIQQQCMPHNNQ
ncbi:lysis protein [Cronobacter sakazakii]|uniref:lysis protein n=1 Tax=Cronobacter sakazakii TaxID=28141 RepID=UPI000BE96A04|nr:lysis protein [Cronobacter sakazakii]MDK1263596.1 lysis protein [Cronobacter sakazakii]MDK1414674.1 lysis protein [Cronobacter sakazakii]PUV43740.1 lysis protein [Cronobacter sakazakii]HDU8021403.1 lysis protein [Cronobacter sakazakii]